MYLFKKHFLTILILITLVSTTGCVYDTQKQTGVNNINNAIKNTNQIKENNTSDSNVYTDNDVGIKFLYPNNYTITQNEIIDFSDTTKSDSVQFSGIKKYLTLQPNSNQFSNIYFYGNSYNMSNSNNNGFNDEALETSCKNNKNPQEYCTIITIDDKKYYFKNVFVNLECSLRFNTKIEIINPNTNSKFTELVFTINLPDVEKDLFQPPYKDNDVCSGNVDIDEKLSKYLQVDFSGNDLTLSDKNNLQTLKNIVNSVESL